MVVMEIWWGNSSICSRFSEQCLLATPGCWLVLGGRVKSNWNGEAKAINYSRTEYRAASSLPKRSNNNNRAKWKQFEIQMHDINNKIDNENGNEFKEHLSLISIHPKAIIHQIFYYYCHLEGLLREQCAAHSQALRTLLKRSFLIQFVTSRALISLSSSARRGCQVAIRPECL